MITNLSNRQNISFNGASGFGFKAVKTLSPEREAIQATFFGQGPVGDCQLLSILKSTMFALNRYAKKKNNPLYNANNWLNQLVPPISKFFGDTQVYLPVSKDIEKTISISFKDRFLSLLSTGNKKVQCLEFAYALVEKFENLKNAAYSQLIDKKDARININKLLWCTESSLVINAFTGLKSKSFFENRSREDFNKNSSKLFKLFKKYPEKLIVTMGVRKQEGVPSPLVAWHAFSLRKVVDDGLIIVNPWSKKNKKIKISFDDFYKYFDQIHFTRLQPKTMFKNIEESRSSNFAALTSKNMHNMKEIQDIQEAVLSHN